MGHVAVSSGEAGGGHRVWQVDERVFGPDPALRPGKI